MRVKDCWPQKSIPNLLNKNFAKKKGITDKIEVGFFFQKFCSRNIFMTKLISDIILIFDSYDVHL